MAFRATALWTHGLILAGPLFAATGLAKEPAAIDDAIPVYGPLVTAGRGDANYTMQLSRRAEPGAPGADTYGKLIGMPGCFFCPKPALSVVGKQGRELLAELSTNTMISYMMSDEVQLKNMCVFYTKNVENNLPGGLSARASTWACEKGKLSIWHLWPNIVNEQSDSVAYRDFYGIENPTNWLHSIDGLEDIPSDNKVPPKIQYFQHMSEAMARSCTGEVVIMTQTPDDMVQYSRDPENKNIWADIERPALMARLDEGRVTKFLVVDYNNPELIYKFNISTNARGERVTPGDLLSRRGFNTKETDEGVLARRAASCRSSGLGQILAAGDQFTDEYSKFL